MRKILVLQVIVLLASLNLNAQHKVGFYLDTASTGIKNSLYNKVRFIDIRNDTTNLGFVQTGLLNRSATVVSEPPLSTQVFALVNRSIDASAGSGELVLQLRQLSFAEVTGAMSEKGFCRLRAGLYAGANEKYGLIEAVDTLLQVKGVDVTSTLLRAGSRLMAGLITDALQKSPKLTETYTMREIIRIDSVEKSRIKLFNVLNYTDGLYTSYQQFMNQLPEKQIVVEGYNIYPDAVKAPDENNKLRKVKAQNIYAIVYQGQPYIASRFEYYPLKKVGDDFLFTGNAKISTGTTEQVTAAMLFGMLGSIAVSNSEGRFEMKIDHKNGSFIKIREIKEPVKPVYNED
ncbi:hypothetical protein [Mucilaginibacter celer]|uniref:Uncharacterized protein n=1 Tax=Mucilaginibacter celer TaxID=2305508 RepID=A0A494VU50_9SPHI|nr:hypothetical protein [Mucilaginibacter celer]AYL97899.1 hypothetical protein HYN43_022525 [Mucilaginibacter celer]